MQLRSFAFFAATFWLIAAFPVAADDDKTASICAEAEERYIELFGQPSSKEEGITIVTTYKYKFCPEQITVPRGTTIRWVNVDKRTSHSVLVKGSGIPESERFFPEESFEFKFLIPGRQDYLCGPHWETHAMFGMVTVEE